MNGGSRPLLVMIASVLAAGGVASAGAGGGQVTELACPEARPAFDPGRIDRSLKEPKYGSERPMYRFFAFGQAGGQVVALVIDESKGTGSGYDTLYIDANANRDITEPSERLALQAVVQPKPARGQEGCFHVATSGWGKPPLINRRKLQIDDGVFDYYLTVAAAGFSVDCVLKDGSWHTCLRSSDGSAPWSPDKAAALVFRYGGKEFSFRNEHFAGKTVKAGEGVFLNLTAPFFAGFSPSVVFDQGDNWVAAGYDDINVYVESLEDPSLPKVDITLRGY